MEITPTNGRASSPVADLLYAYVKGFATGREDSAQARHVAARLKAAQNPADTVTPGWAAELVQDQIAAYIASLPNSVLGQLLALSIRVNAGAAGIRVPVRLDDTAARFVGQGDPIPILSGYVGAANLRDQKLAIICALTQELASAPGAAPLVQTIAAEAVSAGADAVLLSDDAGSDTQPPGLFAGAIAPIAGTDNAAADLAALITAVPNATRPAFLMNDAQTIGAMAASIMQGGTIGRAQVIISGHMPAGSVAYMDVQDLVFSVSDSLEIAQTDEAILHMESSPLPITDGTGEAAKPVTSLWQIGAFGVRTVWPLSWTLRRPGRVSLLTGAAW